MIESNIKDIDVAIGFIVELIDTAMQRYNIDFETTKNIYTRMGYWDKFNNISVMCVGAHEDPEPIYERIKEYL